MYSEYLLRTPRITQVNVVDIGYGSIGTYITLQVVHWMNLWMLCGSDAFTRYLLWFGAVSY
jgi:hypothetical protein